MEFLDAGQKLKRLRKQLRMKQEELSDSNMTRAFISMIEIGQRYPSKDNSEFIVKKLMNKAKELGIPLVLDSAYLTRDAREDAEFYCNQKLQGAASEEEALHIIGIGKEYNLSSVLAEAYLLLGNLKFESKDYMESFLAYMNSLNYHKTKGVVQRDAYLYNRMGLCKLNLLQFLEASDYFNLANQNAILRNDQEIRKKSVYNMALCKKKLGKIEEALKDIELTLSICDKEKDFTIYNYAVILKANCYEAQGLFDEAIETLQNLAKGFTNTLNPILGYAFNSLGVAYLNKELFEDSIRCFDLSQEIREKIDRRNLSNTTIEKAFAYIRQDLYEEAVNLLKEGFNLAVEENDLEYELKSCYALGDIYNKLGLYGETEVLYLKVLDLLSHIDIDYYNDERIKIYSRLAQVYLKVNDLDKLKEILDKLQNIT